MGPTNVDDIRIEEIKNKLESVLGNEKVLDDDYILASYTRDGTVLYYPLSRPSLVTLPHTTEEVQKVVQIANEYKIPVVACNGRTNSWAAVDSNHGIVIDTFNMNGIIEIDEKNLTFTVQAGAGVHVTNRELNKRGFCYPTHALNFAPISFGSEVCKNSGGVVGSMYGHAAKRLIGLKVVLGNGDILETGSSRVIKNGRNFLQSGIPDLSHLFVSAEGAFGVITEVTMGMQMVPVATEYMDVKFEGSEEGMKNLVNACQELRIRKLAGEAHASDWYTFWLFERGRAGKGVEVDGESIRKQFGHLAFIAIDSFISQEECDLKKQAALEICGKHGGVYLGDQMAKGSSYHNMGVEYIRGLFAESSPGVPFWTEAPYEDVPKLYAKWLEIVDSCNWPREKTLFEMAFGDESCLPAFWTFPDVHDAESMRKWKEVNGKAMEFYAEMGTVPYRIGRVWRPYILDKLDSGYLKYIRGVKRWLDPNNIMNPGVSVFEEEYS